MRYLELKVSLRSIRDIRRICRGLDPYLGKLSLSAISGDVVWSICAAELKRGNAPATVNRYLAVIRSILRMARDEWQWIDSFPRIRLLPGEVERGKNDRAEEPEKRRERGAGARPKRPDVRHAFEESYRRGGCAGGAPRMDAARGARPDSVRLASPAKRT